MTQRASLSCTSCNAPLHPADSVCPNCHAPVTAVGSDAAVDADPLAFLWDGVMQRLREITLGQYEILTELGRGGMAAVFLAHEFALDRKVALKVMSPAMMMGEGMIQRFNAEARTQAALIHHHIVGVHSVRQEKDLHYFAMQFVPGRSLQQVLKAERKAGRHLSVAVIRSLLHQIGSALAYSHRKGVIHRDVKPANILLNADGDAVVTDFGIAKVTANPSQTMTGTVVGTAPYMSPEQCYALELTGASDQYSLGILAYELLTGAPPFTGSSFTVMQAHTLEAPPPIPARRPDCPPDLAAAVMRMLAKNSVDRFPDVTAALRALNATSASTAMDDPLRAELMRLADVVGVELALGDVLRTPLSPAPRTRSKGGGARGIKTPAPQRPALPDAPPSGPQDDLTLVVKLRLGDPPTHLEVGERSHLTAVATNSLGEAINNATLVWSSSDPKVARIDSVTGDIEGRSVGHADIVVTSGAAVATTRFTVKAARAAKLVAGRIPTAIEVGQSEQVTAQVLDARGAALDRVVVWASGDPSKVTVSSTGSVTARAPGLARLIATVEGLRSEFPIRIDAPRVATIELGELPEVLGVGESVATRVTLRDKRGRELTSRLVELSSTAPQVARVGSDGIVTGVAAGRTAIKAVCDDGMASVAIAVGSVPVARIEVDGIPSHVTAGFSRRLTITVTDATGRIRRIPPECTSSNLDVASINDALMLTARAPGEAILRVRCGSMERVFPLRVEAVVPISERATRVWAGAPKRLVSGAIVGVIVAALALKFGPGLLRQQTTPIPPAVSSPAPAVTKEPEPVSPSPEPPASRPDPAVIPPSAAATVTRMAITPLSQREFEVGQQIPLHAQIDRSGEGTIPQIRWSLKNPSIGDLSVQVGSRTQLRAQRDGEATVVAEAGGQRDSVILTIVDTRIARIDLDPAAATLGVDQKDTLRASVRTASGRVIASTGLTWKSSQPDVVSVDAAGVATARSPGVARIHAEVGEIRSTTIAIEVPEPERVAPSTPPVSITDPPRPAERPRDPAALASAAREAASTCGGVYSRRDKTQIEQWGRGGNSTEMENQRTLISLFDGFKATVTPGAAGPPNEDGEVARLSIPIRVSWRNNVGRDLGRNATLLATLRYEGNAWKLEACRIQGSLR